MLQSETLRPLQCARSRAGFTLNIIDTPGLVEGGCINDQALDIIRRCVHGFASLTRCVTAPYPSNPNFKGFYRDSGSSELVVWEFGLGNVFFPALMQLNLDDMPEFCGYFELYCILDTDQ